MSETNMAEVAVLIRETVGTHGVLMNLGISENDIWVNWMPGKPLQVVATQGDLTFVIDVGVEPADKLLSQELFTKEWKEAVHLFNQLSTEDQHAIVKRTIASTQTADLASQMTAKGFKLQFNFASN